MYVLVFFNFSCYCVCNLYELYVRTYIVCALTYNMYINVCVWGFCSYVDVVTSLCLCWIHTVRTYVLYFTEIDDLSEVEDPVQSDLMWKPLDDPSEQEDILS